MQQHGLTNEVCGTCNLGQTKCGVSPRQCDKEGTLINMHRSKHPDTTSKEIAH